MLHHKLKQRHLHKLSLNSLLRTLEALIGVQAIGLAFILFYDKNFFFWPPDWSPIFNSIYVVQMGVIGGVLTLLISLLNIKSNPLFVITFVINAGFSGLLAWANFLPVLLIGYHSWHMSSILMFGLFALVLIVAFFHQPESR